MPPAATHRARHQALKRRVGSVREKVLKQRVVIEWRGARGLRAVQKIVIQLRLRRRVVHRSPHVRAAQWILKDDFRRRLRARQKKAKR